MRPISAGVAPYQRSKIQVKTGNRGLCRQTEPRDADTQMPDFLKHGTVPVLSFKATRDKVQDSLSRPLQAVKTNLVDIATGILDSVVERWGCVDDLVNATHGDKIDQSQAEQFIEQYLEDHNVPGKLQVRWVKCLSSGGKLQEYGRRGDPTGRKLRLWINSGFAGAAYSTSIRAFADHEICTHAVRAINDHSQVTCACEGFLIAFWQLVLACLLGKYCRVCTVKTWTPTAVSSSTWYNPPTSVYNKRSSGARISTVEESGNNG